MLGLKVRDCTAGFRCFRAEALRKIDFTSILAEGYSFQVEMLYRILKTGGRVAEIPIIFEERRHGRSKISRTEVFRAIGTVLRLFRERRSSPAAGQPE
jgi:dolichol-phosphate mannosyltransferase